MHNNTIYTQHTVQSVQEFLETQSTRSVPVRLYRDGGAGRAFTLPLFGGPYRNVAVSEKNPQIFDSIYM